MSEKDDSWGTYEDNLKLVMDLSDRMARLPLDAMMFLIIFVAALYILSCMGII